MYSISKSKLLTVVQFILVGSVLGFGVGAGAQSPYSRDDLNKLNAETEKKCKAEGERVVDAYPVTLKDGQQGVVQKCNGNSFGPKEQCLNDIKEANDAIGMLNKTCKSLGGNNCSADIDICTGKSRGSNGLLATALLAGASMSTINGQNVAGIYQTASQRGGQSTKPCRDLMSSFSDLKENKSDVKQRIDRIKTDLDEATRDKQRAQESYAEESARLREKVESINEKYNDAKKDLSDKQAKAISDADERDAKITKELSDAEASAPLEHAAIDRQIDERRKAVSDVQAAMDNIENTCNPTQSKSNDKARSEDLMRKQRLRTAMLSTQFKLCKTNLETSLKSANDQLTSFVTSAATQHQNIDNKLENLRSQKEKSLQARQEAIKSIEAQSNSALAQYQLAVNNNNMAQKAALTNFQTKMNTSQNKIEKLNSELILAQAELDSIAARQTPGSGGKSDKSFSDLAEAVHEKWPKVETARASCSCPNSSEEVPNWVNANTGIKNFCNSSQNAQQKKNHFDDASGGVSGNTTD